MSSILTTEAIVLSALDYSDSSKIVNLLTREAGRISVIAKGARQKKSKLGAVLNPPNIIQAVIYVKPNRDMQILSTADLLVHHAGIEKDYDTIKYAWAVLELVNVTLHEHEHEEKIFRAVERILQRIDSKIEDPFISFLRFFFFLFGELGYEIDPLTCSSCQKAVQPEESVFTTVKGMLCISCAESTLEKTYLSKELFFTFQCLKNGKEVIYTDELHLKKIYRMLENYATMHISSFRPLNSLKL